MLVQKGLVMQRSRLIKVEILIMVMLTLASTGLAEIKVLDLRCEYLKNPQGIDVEKPRLSWKLGQTGVSSRNLSQKAYHVLVASSAERLTKGQGDLWDSGKSLSSQSTQVAYDGKALKTRGIYYWQVRIWDQDGNPSDWSEPARWSMGLLKPEDWSGKWISAGEQTPIIDLATRRNSPMLRKTFKISKPVKQAQVSICGLGYYELYLNGSKVGDHRLDPMWTCYHKNALYVTYDVADDLCRGGNAFGVQLANGIYNQRISRPWRFDQAPWRAFPQMRLQLDIVYADGTKQQIISDQSWKASYGPIFEDSAREGVQYDARLEQPGWATFQFDDKNGRWCPAVLREGVLGTLTAQMSNPIKVIKTLKPVKTEELDGGYYIDFGQNIAGWVRLKVSGERGTMVVMDYYATSGKHYNQRDIYILKGGGQEVWEPVFTYHGFSKVKISGLTNKPKVEACVVYSAFEERGAFECSNPLLNKITEMSRWSYVGNFVGIPTDCPHREKCGWSGDAQVSAELGLTYYGSEADYTRWMLDFQAIQREDGKLPCIVPTGGWGFNRLDGPSWEIAYIQIPWHIYEYRGDRRILETHYEDYKRWFNWYRNHPNANKGHIINYGLGDWAVIGTRAPRNLTSTGYYYVAAKRIAAIAEMLGKAAEQKEYSDLAQEIKDAFNREFYKGGYHGGRQTATSCALYHGLVEPENHELVVKNLVQSIRQGNYRLDVGYLGAKYLLRVLSDNNYADVAYAMAIKDDTPGWGRMARSGNTTLCETATCADTNSDNHVFFGDIAAWFVNYLAGIRHDPSNPGFQRFLIKPEVVGDLTWVKAHHDSPYGRIQSNWKREDTELSLKITVPVNSVAEVFIPTDRADLVHESGKSASKADGVKFLRMENHRAIFEVGSGAYHFTSKLP